MLPNKSWNIFIKIFNKRTLFFYICLVLIGCHQKHYTNATYKWQANDNKKTIQTLAKKYNTSAYEIRSHNGLFDLNDAYAGLILQIPVKENQEQQNQLNKTKKSNAKIAFIKPAKGRTTSHFGQRWGRKHEGIDFSSKKDHDIIAAESGVVVFSGRKNGYGNTIIIKHNNKYKTLYAHNHKHFVKKSQRVRKGEKIAQMGSTGKSTGVHLHFEIQVYGKAVNPLTYLSASGGH